jgi:hypothetical protein
MFEMCALKVKSARVPVKNPPNPAISHGDSGPSMKANESRSAAGTVGLCDL